MLAALFIVLLTGCTSTFHIPFADLGRFASNEPVRVANGREIRLDEAVAVSPHEDADNVEVQSLTYLGAWEVDDEAPLSVKKPWIALKDDGATIRGKTRQMWVPNGTLAGGLDVVVEDRGARAGKIAGGVIGGALGVALIITAIVVASQLKSDSPSYSAAFANFH